MTDSKQPLISHLIELRKRLLIGLLIVLLVTLALLPFSNTLYTFLSEPLLKQLPENSSMIATSVTSPFLAPFKLTITAAIFLSIPLLLYQVWAFIAPGLYKHEKKFVFPLLFTSTFLFFLGITFAYFVVFPLIFSFFTQTAPENVTVMTDISQYLDFVLKLFFAFGLAFQVPVITFLITWSGITDTETLKQQRPYVIVGAFFIGMLLTPPDIFSQTMLALPIWFLFELGLLSTKLIKKTYR